MELCPRLEDTRVGRGYCAELGAFGFDGNYRFVVVLDRIPFCIGCYRSSKIGKYKTGIGRKKGGFPVKGGVVV